MFHNFSKDSDETVGTGLIDTDAAPFLPRRGVEAWLMRINRALGRGSEFRAAEAFMGPGPGGGLTLEGTETRGVLPGAARIRRPSVSL